MKIKKHRTAPDNWKLKSATVTQEASGKYYVSVLYEYESQVIEQNNTDKTIGLDFAMNGLYVDSNGFYAEMPHFLRESEKRLQELQTYPQPHHVLHQQRRQKQAVNSQNKTVAVEEKAHKRFFFHSHCFPG